VPPRPISVGCGVDTDRNQTLVCDRSSSSCSRHGVFLQHGAECDKGFRAGFIASFVPVGTAITDVNVVNAYVQIWRHRRRCRATPGMSLWLLLQIRAPAVCIFYRYNTTVCLAL